MRRRSRTDRIRADAIAIGDLVRESTRWVEVIVPPAAIKSSAPFVCLTPQQRETLCKLARNIIEAAQEGRVRQ